MAHMAKYSRAACGHLFKHYARDKDENGEYIQFGNQDIDLSRTHLNYNLAAGLQPLLQGDFVRRRCSEVSCLKRKDVNVMCSWVVTAPADLPPEDTDKFFEATFDFLCKRYGKENVVSAWVHLDENRPHIHFAFVPVAYDKDKDEYKVSAKLRCSRSDLRSFHKDFSAFMTGVFGRDIGVLNGATKDGNLTIPQLKAQQAQYEELKIQRSRLQGEIGMLEMQSADLRDEATALQQENATTRREGERLYAAVTELAELKTVAQYKQQVIDNDHALDTISDTLNDAEQTAIKSGMPLNIVNRLWKIIFDGFSTFFEALKINITKVQLYEHLHRRPERHGDRQEARFEDILGDAYRRFGETNNGNKGKTKVDVDLE